MKRVTLKRISAFVLAMIMTLSLCPVTALAELIPERYEASFSYAAEDDGISNDELFAAYAQREFDAALGYEIPSFYRTSALESGTLEKEIYDALKAELAKIAAGDESSTVITVEPTGSWSAEDLGVTALFENSALTADAKSAIGAKLTLIYQCLLADSPLELYWHDKTIGYNASYSYYIVEPFSAEFTFVFAVATDYLAEGDTTGTVTDTTKTGAAATAVANAQAIVDANYAKSDTEKLAAYKDAICNLVSYNQSAASFGSSAYGINPWQMVYVFDGNDSTNVVCEGYAKAFQYLCDLTEFDGDIECHTVNGYMSGGTGAGGHMWNVVTMDDGKNYLVDVTNCDSGTIGADDKLFMAYTTNSADNNQTHTFTIEGQNIVFTYDAAMADLFCDGYLALSTAAYTKPVQSLEATATLTGSTTPLAPGDTVTLTLSFDGINIAGIDATLAFDDAVLTLVNTETLVGGTMDAETLKFVFLNESSPINAATDVLKVTLKVKESVTAGAELNVSFKDIVVSNGTNDLDIAAATWTGTVAGEAEARWGLATGTDRDKTPADNNWVKSGTLADAMIYANSFASGTAYIQLLSDVNTTAPLIFATGKTTILDLNGHTIDRGLTDAVENGEVIAVNGDLTIVDSSSTDVSKQGKITGGYTAPPVNNVGGGGGGVNVFGSFTMDGGVITENTGTTGGVWVVAGNFTMNGGAITGNTASDMGGGVYVNSRCTFTMNGGTISDNTAVSGGGVNMNFSSTFTMNGGSITENTATNNGGGVYSTSANNKIQLSGAPYISENTVNAVENNVYLVGGSVIAANTLSSGTKIGVTLSNGAGTFTSGGADYANSGYFVSNNTAYKIVADGNSGLKLAENLSGDVRWGITYNHNAPTVWSGSGSLTDAMTFANNLENGSAYVQLIRSVKTRTAVLTFESNTSTILDLNGRTIDRGIATATSAWRAYDGNVITVKGSLVLTDSSTTVVENQGKITGGYNYGSGGGVIIKRNAHFTMNGGNITGNKIYCDWAYGGGVNVEDGGTFIMNNGTISKNYALNYYSDDQAPHIGGGVNVFKGTFTMNGGSISDNWANHRGGGVSIMGGTFTMNSGNISGNTITGNGTMTNYSPGLGGGVYLGDGSFIMNGGTITGNINRVRGGAGGGVYVGNGTFRLSGSSIIGNNKRYSSPSSVIENVYLANGKVIDVGSLATDTSIGITMENKVGTFTSGGAEYANSGYFSSDNAAYEIVVDGANLKLVDPTQVTISFHANGGGGTMSAQNVQRGADISLNANTFTREGYAFTGWNTKADGTGTTYADSSTVNASVDIILYAQWEKDTLLDDVTLGGEVTSFLNTTDGVTVELYDGETLVESVSAVYTDPDDVKQGATYSISGVAAGTYTMKVSKANHVTREYTVTVGAEAVTQDAKIHPIGDVTGDGKVRSNDVAKVYNHVTKTELITDAYIFACGEVTGDKIIRSNDVGKVYNHVTKTELLW